MPWSSCLTWPAWLVLRNKILQNIYIYMNALKKTFPLRWVTFLKMICSKCDSMKKAAKQQHRRRGVKAAFYKIKHTNSFSVALKWLSSSLASTGLDTSSGSKGNLWVCGYFRSVLPVSLDMTSQVSVRGHVRSLCISWNEPCWILQHVCAGKRRK